MRTTVTALMLAACAAVPALANDTSAELATGGLLFVQNDNVEMRSEDLAISAKQVDERLQTAERELEARSEFAHVVVNDRLEEATQELDAIVRRCLPDDQGLTAR